MKTIKAMIYTIIVFSSIQTVNGLTLNEYKKNKIPFTIDRSHAVDTESDEYKLSL